jgi:hypothetical protein
VEDEEGTMKDMNRDDWTTDDSLSEEEIREHLADEGWEPVQALEHPVSVIEERIVSAAAVAVWSHSDEFDDERVRTPAA